MSLLGPRPSDSAAESDSSKYILEVSEATLGEALVSYRKITGQELGVRSYVERQASCVRLSFRVRSNSIADVDRALDDALAEKGLAVHDRSGLRLVERDPDRPSPCGAASGLASGFAAPSTTTDEELAKQIVRVSDRHFQIPRSALDSSLMTSGRSARVVPAKGGIKLFSIPPGGVLAALGFGNGDLVTSINGANIGEPSAALELYTRLRGVDHLEVAVERANMSSSISIDILPDGASKSPSASSPAPALRSGP